MIVRRAFLAGLAGTCLAGRAARAAPEAPHGASWGELLLCGFTGKDPSSPSAQWLARQIRAGRAAGAVFVKENIGGRDDVAALTALFAHGAPRRPILAIDHEGGAVQRLGTPHGFARLPSARAVAAGLSPGEAEALYGQAGADLAALGFNLNLAPDLDLDVPGNPAIGRFGRAFSADPQVVAAYGRAFVEGFRKAGVRCTLKHFPGQGGTLQDSHLAPAAEAGWTQDDLVPFRSLIAEGRAPVVLTGLAAAAAEPGRAAALSRAVVTGLLRDELGFEGLALTDDLDMGATGGGADRRRAMGRALQAGNDLLMVRNVDDHDPDLSESLAAAIAEGLAAGELSLAALRRSAARVRAFRAQGPA